MSRRRVPPKGGYTPEQASKLLGIKYGTILYWIRTRLTRASVQREGKQWTPVILSKEDLLEHALVKELRAKGVSTSMVRRVLQVLRKSTGRDFCFAIVRGELRVVPVEVAATLSVTEVGCTVSNVDLLWRELERKLEATALPERKGPVRKSLTRPLAEHEIRV